MRLLAVLCGLMLVTGCDDAPEPAKQPLPVEEASPWHAEQQALSRQLTEETTQRLRRLSVSAGGFGDAIDGLLQDPTNARLTTAREAWRQLYQNFNEAYAMLACRASLNPTDQARLERADVFPILPGYVDGLQEWPDSGIVNDPVLPLTREALLEQQGATQEGEASVGFQVIRFLLHGEPETPRQADAFQSVAEAPEGQEGKVEDQPANRRREYLHTASTLLVEDLALLTREGGVEVEVTPACPVGALQEVVSRLIRLENLRDNTAVHQEYLAAESRSVATAGLQDAARPWLGDDTALAAWLRERLPEKPLPTGLPELKNAKGDVRLSALQQSHAALASLRSTLAAKPL